MSESPALSFGKLFHSCLEQWWKKGINEAVKYLANQVQNGLDEQTAAQVLALLAHYNPPREKFVVVDVEKQFEMKIENSVGGRAFRGYRLQGKVDLILRSIGEDKVWIVDHKTTTQEVIGFGSYWQGLQVDAQMANYCLAFDAVGFIYDVIRKPSIKLCGKDESEAKKTGICPADAYQARIELDIKEAPETWYQWREHPKTESDSIEARLDLFQHCEMHRACCADSRFPRNSNSCSGRYGTCPYLEVCAGRANIENDAMFRTKAQANEELE